jgi:hypothetical protein
VTCKDVLHVGLNKIDLIKTQINRRERKTLDIGRIKAWLIFLTVKFFIRQITKVLTK